MVYGSEEFNKALVNLIRHKDKDEGKHSCYSECVEHADEMSWHLYGEKPLKLLERTRPREDEEIKNYRIENYEPITKSAADKCINIVSKIFNPNISSIRQPKDKTSSSQALWEYSMLYYPEHNSVVNFTKDVLLRKMLADPNAVAAVRPRFMPQTDADQLQPIIKLFGSKNIWYFDDEHYLIFIDVKEESAQQGTLKWFYFEYYDRDQFIGFKAYVSPTEQLYLEELETYAYQFEEIPVWRLQGIVESLDNGEVMYKSFFAAAAPFWNLAIVHESDVLGAYINHMHPLRWEISEECDYKHEWEGSLWPCRGGTITFGHDGEQAHTLQCTQCGGTGTKSFGPYGVMKIPKSKLDADLGIRTPVDYVNVPTDATKMLEERAARMEQKGMWAINMDVEDEIGEVQSGAAKVIDRSAQYDMLANIASVVYDVHLQNIFYYFNLLMNGVSDKSTNKDTDKNLPEINKPTQFDIAGTAELINNLKGAKEAGLDPSVLNMKEQEILTRDFSTNPDLKQFSQLLLDLDPVQGLDPDTISLSVSKGFISQTDAVIHFNKKRFIERAISENKNFLTLPKKEQVEILEKYGDEFVKKNKPKLDTSMLDASKQKFAQA